MPVNIGNVIGGVVGGPTGAFLGGMFGKKKGMRQKVGQVPKQYPGGMANYYDDSWARLLAGMQSGRGASGTLTDILQNFKGSPGDLEDFMQRAGPFLGAGQAASMERGPAFQYMQDPKNWDLGAMSAFGPAAGMIGRGAQQASQTGAQQLAASGLGRGAARASMQQMAQQGASGQQADLWQRLYQQAQQNRMSSASNALEAHRMVAQVALGQVPTPRMMDSSGGGGMSGLGIAAGIAGGAAGGLAGGPLGAALGALAGGLGGFAQKK